MELADLKRGDRYAPDYVGTVVEVVEVIPDFAPKGFVGKPGVLVYWHYTDVTGVEMDEMYPSVLPERVTKGTSREDFGLNLQFVPLERLLDRHYTKTKAP